VIAFEKFKEIDSLKNIQDKHKAWLKDYEGLKYSIAKEEIHLMKWQSHPKKYKDSEWDIQINCIGRKGNRTCIEFDDKDEDGNKDKEKIRKNLEIVKTKLKENGWGFIESTHFGNSNYLWVEFDRDLNDKEVEQFLMWIMPEEKAEIDLNFASSKKVFPVLYAIHWKHSMQRELPVYFQEGKQIEFDKLEIKLCKKISKIVIKEGGYKYETFEKDSAGDVFGRHGQAKAFYEQQPYFYDKIGLFWIWNPQSYCWEMTDEVAILNMIYKSTGQNIISSKERTEIINVLKQEGRNKIPKELPKDFIQFKDIMFNINTGEEIKVTPDYFVTNPIAYPLHKDKLMLTPTMDLIFEQWVGKDYVQTLYEIIAYCCLPDYPIHRLFCFVGAGMNGKSCFLKLLKKFIGEKNVTSTELDILMKSRFEVTRLYKKLVCMMGETNFNEISQTSIIKKLTGQDTIGFEYKNKNLFDDMNYAKIIIATNNLPATTDKTIGFYRRWLIIDFPNQFSEEKDILLSIPEEEYECLARKVAFILQDLLKNRKFHYE
jgi:P4 family phage/plasmid primase-like protien